MVEPVCCRQGIPRNCGSVACTVLSTEVFGAGIYSSVTIYGPMVLTDAVGAPLGASAFSLRHFSNEPLQSSFHNATFGQLKQKNRGNGIVLDDIA